jgi:hypothetical protein
VSTANGLTKGDHIAVGRLGNEYDLRHTVDTRIMAHAVQDSSYHRVSQLHIESKALLHLNQIVELARVLFKVVDCSDPKLRIISHVTVIIFALHHDILPLSIDQYPIADTSSMTHSGGVSYCA